MTLRLLLLASFSPTDAWGWLSLVLLVISIAIPYALRSKSPSQASSAFDASRGTRILWIHYWLGPLIFALSFVHAWIPMATGHMPHTSMQGLWLATYALGLILLQVLLGLALRYFRRGARVLRWVHFAVMLGIGGLLLAHLWLNGPPLRLP